MLQIDLNGDLEEEPDLESWCCFTLFEPLILGSWICVNTNVGKCAPICVTL